MRSGSHEFINTGTFTKSGDGGTTTFDEDIFFRNRGMVNANNGTIDFRGGFAQTAGVTTLDGGTITDSASNLMTFAGGGINGSGTIMAGVNLDAVTVAPGFSPGVLHIAGNLVTSNATIFDMEIESAASFDQVIVDGTASLAGTMNIIVSNGFEPENISFDLITSMDGNSGTFGTFNPPGTAATATEFYNPNDYTVEFGSAPPPQTPPSGEPPRREQPPPPPPIVDDGPDEPLMFTPDLTPIVVVLIEQDDPDVPGEFDPDSPVSLLRSSLLQCL